MTPPAESPVYGHLAGPSMVDYPGKLAAVFFLSGCNFRCRFCHNAALIDRQNAHLSWTRLEQACSSLRDNWADAAVISGGEPTLCEELPELISFFHEYGWSVKLDTNGARPRVLEEILGELDYVAMDIKTSLAHYPDITGFSDTDRIADSVKLIMDAPVDYEFRTTVEESMHSVETMADIASLIEGARRYVLQPFVPQPGLPDPSLESFPRTSPDYMEKLADAVGGHVQKVLIRGE